jgi:hypothetical protein
MKLLTSLHLIFQEENNLRREEEAEDTSDGGGHDSEKEEQEPEQEEQHEEEGHYEGEARHYKDEVVGVTDLLQDLHSHIDTRLATSFALL